MRAVCGSIVVLAALQVARPAAGHIQLQSPVARYVQNDSGLKTSPCGSGTATGTVTRLIPGQTLSVTWKESVPHAGHYRIALSAKEADFAAPTSLAIPQPAPAWVLADGIADKTGTQTYAQTVALPNQECPACVLQLVQVMSSGTDGTNTGAFSGVYYACADLAIAAANADGGASRDLAGAEVTADRPADVADVRARDAASEGVVDVAAPEAPWDGADGDTAVSGSGGRAGAGGAAGMGGAGGNAGGVTGGTPGNVSATGGTSASGGSAATVVATGGRAGSGGAGATSTVGTGGTVAGTGGAAGGGTASTATAPAGPGCSCRIGNPGAAAPTWPVMGAVALGFAVALRRRHPRPSL